MAAHSRQQASLAFGAPPLKERICMITEKRISAPSRLCTVLTAVTIAVTAVSAWAALPRAEVGAPPVSFDRTELFGAEVELSIAGQPYRRFLRSVQGDLVLVRGDDEADMYAERVLRFDYANPEAAVAADVTIERVEPDQYLVAARIFADGELTASPAMTLDEGSAGSVEVGGSFRLSVRAFAVPATSPQVRSSEAGQ
jgi:hypothetical protein